MNLKGKKRALEPLMFITWKERDTIRRPDNLIASGFF
jgi:hypothetical protein